MKTKMTTLVLSIIFLSCNNDDVKNESKPARNPLTGTWKLITGTLVENGNTTTTDYTQNKSFIKIINDTHFAFLEHDLTKGKDSIVGLVAGGGTYSLDDSLYTEHLEYCSAREWEGND